MGCSPRLLSCIADAMPLRLVYIGISPAKAGAQATGLAMGYQQLWVGRSRSLTVLTGLKVLTGTSTKTVFQSLMAPFQSPGRSMALISVPLTDLLLMNPVSVSTKSVRLNFLPLALRR